jgi:hypothetical protein
MKYGGEETLHVQPPHMTDCVALKMKLIAAQQTAVGCRIQK